MCCKTKLPAFLRPMLAQAGRPFDSTEHLFEVKWDGIRCSAFIEHGTSRLFSRLLEDLFPELSFLSKLPSQLLQPTEEGACPGGRSQH